MRPSLALALKRDQVLALLAARGASRPRIFGSVARGQDQIARKHPGRRRRPMNRCDALFLGPIITAARDIQAFTVDAVWAMVENDLPELQLRVQRLLDTRPT